MVGTRECYSFDIYPTEEQIHEIRKNIVGYRYVYNYYLRMKQNLYTNKGINFGKFSCMGDLKNLKEENPWLKELDSQALVCAIYDLDTDFVRYFNMAKKGYPVQYPRYITKKNWPQVYRTRTSGNGIRMNDKIIRLPKVGEVEHNLRGDSLGYVQSAIIKANPRGEFNCSVFYRANKE